MADTSDSGSEDEGENEESFANPPFMQFSGTQTLRNYVENLELVFGDGNEFSSLKDWGKAEQAYSSCIKLCEGAGKQMEGDSECNRGYNRTLMLAFSNRAEARLRLQHYEKAFGDAEMALSIEPNHVISLVRKGKACHALGLFEQACEVLKVASDESPNNLAILKSLMISTIALEQDKRDIGSEDEGREDEELDNDNQYHRRFNRTLTLAYTNRAETRLRLLRYENALSDREGSRHRAEAPQDSRSERQSCSCSRILRQGLRSFQTRLPRISQRSVHTAEFEEQHHCLRAISTGKFDLTHYFMNGCTGEIPRCEDFVGPVEIRQNPDGRRGRGLFATKSLEQGELLLVSNPVAVVREKSVKHSSGNGDVDYYDRTERILDKLTRKVAPMMMIFKRQMARVNSLGSYRGIPSMDLFRPWTEYRQPSGEENESEDDIVVDIGFVEDIVRTKRFQYVDIEGPRGEEEVVDSIGLWVLPAFANHSCAPNCQHSFVGDTLFFRAFTPIMEGEELTVPYFQVLYGDLETRKVYCEMWMFVCKCERCCFEESLQHQLSKIREAHPEFLYVAVESYLRGDGQQKKRKRSGDKEFSVAVDEVEALIQSLGTSLGPIQKDWIRAAFFPHYQAKFDLDVSVDSPSKMASLKLLLDLTTTVGVGAMFLSLTAFLLFEVKEKYTKDNPFHSEALHRILGLFRLYYGVQPDDVLYNLIVGRVPSWADTDNEKWQDFEFSV
ncbi:unnamed protein product [Calypogeia fissa]